MDNSNYEFKIKIFNKEETFLMTSKRLHELVFRLILLISQTTCSFVVNKLISNLFQIFLTARTPRESSFNNHVFFCSEELRQNRFLFHIAIIK